MRETRLPAVACLACGKIMDAATTLTGDHGPRSGDISLCLYCGHLAAFDAELRLRPLTDAEIVEIAGAPVIIEAQKARGAIMAKKPKASKRGQGRPPAAV
jgi:hypothetical protein